MCFSPAADFTVGAVVAGIGVETLRRVRVRRELIVGALPLLNRIIENKFYFDKVYGAVFARGSMQVGKLLWRYGDQGTIDRFGPDGAAAVSRMAGARLSKLQTGYLYHYAFVMLMALVLLIAWLLFGHKVGA